MESISLLLLWAENAILVFLAVLVAIIAFKLLVGEINTSGLLEDKQTGALSPGRIQLLGTTLIAAGTYVIELVQTLTPGQLPQHVLSVDKELLWLAGGSQLLYLSGKSRSFWLDGLVRLIRPH